VSIKFCGNVVISLYELQLYTLKAYAYVEFHLRLYNWNHKRRQKIYLKFIS